MHNRRKFISTSLQVGIGATAIGTVLSACEAGPPSEEATTIATETRYQNGRSPWPICLDTATIRTASGLAEMIDIAVEAGYDAIEPWDRDLAQYEEAGGDLKALGEEIKERGLFVPSMIGLWGCLPADEAAFQASLAATRNRMRMAAAIGCKYVQAIPNEVGADYDAAFVTDCYRRLIEIGLEDYDLCPALVFVKQFPLSSFAQAAEIALGTDHREARIIPDVFHMYITGGGFNCLKKVRGDFFPIFQFNDAPREMAREEMQDKDRVYPGDGILPLPEILRDLYASGFRECISLELYNRTYHAQDLRQVAATGLEKTLRVIEAAGV
ncbi:MAG: sugar phosphate isomerase/epimerase family protein [Bacteroidota bacterium]